MIDQMKKIFYIICFLAFGLLCITSCSKSFLKEKVYSSYAPETHADSLGFEASITGLYNQLSQFYTYSDQQGWLCVVQVGTDIAYAVQPQGVEVAYYNYNSLISTDNAASFTWSWAYRLINNANIIIKNVENPALVGMSDGNKNQVDAEARFFRAYA